MNGQVSFNQALSSLFYQITALSWSATDNKLTVFVSLFVNETDSTPLVQHAYYIPLAEDSTFQALTETINGLVKQQVEADGLFSLQPFSPPAS